MEQPRRRSRTVCGPLQVCCNAMRSARARVHVRLIRPIGDGDIMPRGLMALSGHRLVRCTCPLLTQSGHCAKTYSARRVRGARLTQRPKAQLPPRLTATVDPPRSQNGDHFVLSWVAPARRTFPILSLHYDGAVSPFCKCWTGRYIAPASQNIRECSKVDIARLCAVERLHKPSRVVSQIGLRPNCLEVRQLQPPDDLS